MSVQPTEPPGLHHPVGSPDSDASRIARRHAAWPCRVAELRFCGVYLPADLVLARQVRTGWIVSEISDVRTWAATLQSSASDTRSAILSIHAVRDVREHEDGTYLLRGMAWDAGYLQRHPQDWIVGPVDEADSVGAAVRKLDGWLRQRYTGRYGART